MKELKRALLNPLGLLELLLHVPNKDSVYSNTIIHH